MPIPSHSVLDWSRPITPSSPFLPRQLHADYYESPAFLFSAVLFLGDEVADAEPRVGGETGAAWER
jgi:hypothetical protein